MMRSFLLATCVFSVASLGVANAGPYYVEMFGGANKSNLEYSSKWVSVDSNTGYVLGANLGTTIDSVPGLRVEGEVAYRYNGLDVVICHDAYEGRDVTWSFMGNVVYDVPVSFQGLHPHVLAGLGYGSRTASLDNTPLEISNSGLVWQVGGGIDTEVADGIKVGIDYRYMNNVDVEYAGVHSGRDEHSVMLNVRFVN